MSRFFIAAGLLAVACGTPSTTTKPTAGGPCRQENAGTCESSTRLLACRQAIWNVESDCKGAGGCRVEGDTVECDTRGNTVGDRCASLGRVRCEPDGGTNILRCSPSGVLVVEFACPASPSQTYCVLGDAGLTCE